MILKTLLAPFCRPRETKICWLIMARRAKHSHGHGSKFARNADNLRVLVDMDGVLCDFEGDFLRRWKDLNPDEKFVPLEERRSFFLTDDYAKIVPNARERIMSIINSEGFFGNLPPLPNAVEAMKEMSGMDGVDVMICTSPVIFSQHCAQEKMNWVSTHFGHDWLERLVMTRDKTVVNGHILIDDKPRISGRENPAPWDHILFSSCHNLHYNPAKVGAKQRLDNWTDGEWKDIILNYKLKLA